MLTLPYSNDDNDGLNVEEGRDDYGRNEGLKLTEDLFGSQSYNRTLSAFTAALIIMLAMAYAIIKLKIDTVIMYARVCFERVRCYQPACKLIMRNANLKA